MGQLRQETGDASAAMALHEQVRAIAESLDSSGHADAEIQAVLGFTHHQIGRILLARAKPAEALASTEQARAIRQRVVKINPSVLEHQRNLAASHTNMGLILAQTSRLQ